jgi:xylulokinase
MENEPEIYARAHMMMLPGDYIAMKMTGEIKTTISGLTEGILWDFSENDLARLLLDYYGIPEDLVAQALPSFSVQGLLTKSAAAELGLADGTPLTYRAGDQPNNALSLNVLKPGEIAATAGTSGVVYGVIDKAGYDRKSRVNTLVHVNHRSDKPRYGVLLCVNGAGILYSWLRKTIAGKLEYHQINQASAGVPVGCDGLTVLPFGNGAERYLENKDPGASIHRLNFNVHGSAHLARAAQEGIASALNHGIGILRDVGVSADRVRAGYGNMFLSPVFTEAFATITGLVVELYNTDGSQGAARGAGIGAGIYATEESAFPGLAPVKTVEPNSTLREEYARVYDRWVRFLSKI